MSGVLQTAMIKVWDLWQKTRFLLGLSLTEFIMGHIVLLGDSIFDNARYVPDRPPVIEQLRRGLPPGWKATLLAVDGDVTADVAGQMASLPGDATHLFVSVGGNDALGQIPVLQETVGT